MEEKQEIRCPFRFAWVWVCCFCWRSKGVGGFAVVGRFGVWVCCFCCLGFAEDQRWRKNKKYSVLFGFCWRLIRVVFAENQRWRKNKEYDVLFRFCWRLELLFLLKIRGRKPCSGFVFLLWNSSVSLSSMKLECEFQLQLDSTLLDFKEQNLTDSIC